MGLYHRACGQSWDVHAEDGSCPHDNINCLEGVTCPKCQSTGPFDINAEVWCRVYDDGVDDYMETEWDETRSYVCVTCGHSGSVRELYGERIVGGRTYHEN